MKKFIFLLFLMKQFIATFAEITPYKFTDEDMKAGGPKYSVALENKFELPRENTALPNIVYYFSPAKVESYPIAIICSGSQTKKQPLSVIHVHRYLLQEFLDAGCAVLSIENCGIADTKITQDVFWNNYTRSLRLQDTVTVIDFLKKNPLPGWNKKFVFFGCSEGGPLVTKLTENFSNDCLATINWAGVGDLSWPEELWFFIDELRKTGPFWLRVWDKMPNWVPFSLGVPKNKNDYDFLMQKILANPCVEKEFMGMTYKYHADAMSWPAINYDKLKTPYLAVTGALDSVLHSSDLFVEKAKQANVLIQYLRVEGVDHYVRKSEIVLQETFAWLKKYCNVISTA